MAAETEIHEDEGMEVIPDEVLDQEASLPAFEILTYPADYTLEVLVDKWAKQQIDIPRFQRGFVWTQVQASKLIESFLLGLPVPAIFLYSDPTTNSLLVVDGQQRLRTISYFFEGYFGEEIKGRRPVFRLTGLAEGSPYLGKTYHDLEQTDPPSYSRLNDSVLRAFVIKQLNPKDDTSIYHVFERLNTGGTSLTPQEIRNCIHHGPFNDWLSDLNKDANWREVFGNVRPDKRQRDIELILRFLALYTAASDYKKPMKGFLNSFMDRHRRDSHEAMGEQAEIFRETAAAVYEHLGPRPFHIRTGLNAAVFDSVFTAFARHRDRIPEDVDDRYEALVDDTSYIELVRIHTTDTEVVASRLDVAEKQLFS